MGTRRSPVRSILILPLLVAAAIIAACDATGPHDRPEKIETLPRALSAAEREVITHSNEFAFDLLREVHARETESPNVFLSPLSASMALGMTLNGAAGATFDSMRVALGLEGMTQEEINQSYHDLTALLLGLDPRIELAIANSTWSRQGVPFHDTFFDAVRAWFDADARELDFSDPASLDVINGWAAEKTNDRIDRVLDDIDEKHILFLLNAVYFKGQWTNRFDTHDTRVAGFTLADGSEVDVPYMTGEPSIGIGYAFGDGGATIIGELPYGGQAFVMDVVLPPADGTLADLIAGLDAGTWAEWVDAIGGYESMLVGLPKLELEYEDTLNAALTAMGMGRAFDPGRADFTRLTPVAETDAVWIDFVKQNTFLKVDEEGTEAAAVTTVGVAMTTSAPSAFIVDRPYLLVIRERLSGTILFMGAIGDPRAD